MAGTSTPNLQLYKPAGPDFVNVATDINANFDKIDSAVGVQGTGGRGCDYGNNLGTTLPIAADVQLEFNVVRNSTGLIVASGTNNRAFTVQATGWYDLGAGMAQGSNIATGVYLYIALGATTPGTVLVGVNNAAKTFPVLSLSKRVYLNSGNVVCVGTSIDTNTYLLDSTRRNYFTGVYLGL